jgi:hypothetical protein
MSSMRAGCVLCCYAHNLSRPVVALILVYFKFSILILRFFLVTQVFGVVLQLIIRKFTKISTHHDTAQH